MVASMIWLCSKVRSAFVICALCIKWTTTHKTCRLAAIPAALKAASASTCAAMIIDLRLGCGSMWHGNNQFSVLMKQDDLILKHFVRRRISGRSSSRAQTCKQWGLRGMTKVKCHRLLARNASKWNRSSINMEVSTRLTKLLNALHDICALGQPAGQEVPVFPKLTIFPSNCSNPNNTNDHHVESRRSCSSLLWRGA